MTPQAIWIDLREEPILYIKRYPYVVRGCRQPFTRLPEFDAGLSGNTIEEISDRLKLDVLTEVMEYDDRILVHNEVSNHELKQANLPMIY